ncbi:hypothetical protein Dimus_000270, partial [Dionaea muscipula]
IGRVRLKDEPNTRIMDEPLCFPNPPSWPSLSFSIMALSLAGSVASNPTSWPSLSPAILPSFVLLIADHHRPAHRRPPPRRCAHLQLSTLLSSADFETNAGHLPSSYHPVQS